MRGFWGQNTLQHLGDLPLHFHLRWTNECKDSDDSRAQSMTPRNALETVEKQLGKSQSQAMSSTSTDDVRILSMNFDFTCGLVLSQLFQRQVHGWFSLAENFQTAVDF